MKKILTSLFAFFAMATVALAQVDAGIDTRLPLGNNRWLSSKDSTGFRDLPMIKMDSSGNLTFNTDTSKTFIFQVNKVTKFALGATGGTITGLSAVPADAGTTPGEYIFTSSATSQQAVLAQGTADTAGVVIDIDKSRKTDGTADTIVASGDTIGTINFKGANGATFDTAAAIIAKVDATPGASADMPGSLDFQLSPDGSATLASVLKLTNDKQATFAGNIIQSAPNIGAIIGKATVAGDAGTTPGAYIFTPSATSSQLVLAQGTASTAGAVLDILKSRATDGTADTIIQAADTIGTINFKGSNGSTFDIAARIVALSENTPGASTDMPGSLDFQVTPDGSATPLSALKLQSTGIGTFSQVPVMPGMNVPTANEEAVAGAGTTVADAAALSATKHVHQITGANGTVGWKFATAVTGQVEILLSTTAGVPKIYAVSGGSCNGGGADVACTLLSGISPHICWASSANAWICG